MNRKELLKRISAMVLALMMTLSMSDFALAAVFAETEPEEQTTELQQETGSDEQEQGDVSADPEASSDADPVTEAAEVPAEETTDEDGLAEETSGDEILADDASDEAQGQTEGVEEPQQPEGEGTEPEDPAEPEENIITITIAENLDGMMKLTWEPVEGAASYTVTKDVCSAYKASTVFSEDNASVTTQKTEITYNKLFPGRRYTFAVTARDGEGNIVGTTETPVSEQPVLSPVKRKARSSKTVNATKMSIGGKPELRKLIGEAYNGYAVMQGGCVDDTGTYAYYLMVSASNQHGKVVKVNRKTNSVVKVSGVLNTWHGNGMAYDSRRHQLVVNARNEGNVKRKQELTCIDADTLTIIPGRQKNVSYKYFSKDETYFDSYMRGRGFANVSYNEKYDVYVCLQRTCHNFIIVDPDTLKAIGLVMTTINAKYPGMHQAMDCDDQYAYQLLSADGSSQPYNLILALDWNANQLVDSNGHRREYVPEQWNCLNNRKPVAVYRIKSPYEAENIFHITDAAGNTHFYLSEYFANQQYKKKYYKVKYKKKWKKVWKKVKVKKKWKKVKKRVKVKGKWKTKKVWKYKYKWKKKKVWKYKTKYKKKYYKVPSYKDRLANLYDLGVI